LYYPLDRDFLEDMILVRLLERGAFERGMESFIAGQPGRFTSRAVFMR
jgi:hypothetical protein